MLNRPEWLWPSGHHVYYARAKITLITILQTDYWQILSASLVITLNCSWVNCSWVSASNLYVILIVPSGPCTSAAQSPPFLPSVYE